MTLPETGVQEQAWVGKVAGTCEGQCREERCGNGALPFSGRWLGQQLSWCSL